MFELKMCVRCFNFRMTAHVLYGIEVLQPSLTIIWQLTNFSIKIKAVWTVSGTPTSVEEKQQSAEMTHHPITSSLRRLAVCSHNEHSVEY